MEGDSSLWQVILIAKITIQIQGSVYRLYYNVITCWTCDTG